MNSDTEVSIRFRNSVTGEKKLKEYADTLKTIRSVVSGIDKGMIKEVEDTAQKTSDIAKDLKSIESKTTTAFNYSAIRTFGRALANTTRAISKAVSSSASYLENMNLLDVAFNNNTKEADKFVSRLTEMYGLDESWGYRTVGIFKQLANAMGVSAEAGDKLSTILTQLSIDTASLYNIDTSDAVSIFSSALAGQTKPARRLGADITQSTLQQTLNETTNSLQKALEDAENSMQEFLNSSNSNFLVANLTYAEKRLVIVASLLRQLQQANNDWGRTIESVANQTRILHEQWNRLTRAIGNVFLPIAKAVLPYLNAILMVLVEIINSFAVLLGYDPADFDFFTELDESVVDLADGLGIASSNAKKLKQGLRGFDKLNNITTPSAGSSGVGGGFGGGIDPSIMDLFNKEVDKYNSKLTDVQMKATKIRDRIMEWLGYTKQVDEETGKVSFKFDHITIGTVLGGLAVGGAVVSGVKVILKILERITGLKFLNLKAIKEGFSKLPALGTKILTFLKDIPLKTWGIIGVVTVLVGAFIDLYKNSEEFRKKVDKIVKLFKEDFTNVLKSIKGILEPLLKTVFDLLKRIWNEVLQPLWKIVVSVLEPVFNAILDIVTILWEKVLRPMQPFLKWLVDTALIIISTTLNTIVTIISRLIEGVTSLWKNVVSPFINFVVTAVEKTVIPVINTIGDVIEGIKKAIQKIVDWWNNLSFNKKKVEVEYSAGGGGYSAGGGGSGARGGKYANGGLPPVGQVFVANEKGAELVGHIGGQTFVANQNQMMDLLDRKIGNAQTSKTPQIYNIYLDKNHKIATYTLEELEGMAKTNGKPITIGG